MCFLLKLRDALFLTVAGMNPLETSMDLPESNPWFAVGHLWGFDQVLEEELR